MAFKYQVLVQRLTERLESGYWQIGEKLPSVRSLCSDYECSLATVQHALQQLEAKGFVKAVDRSGYYVQISSSRTAQLVGKQKSLTATPYSVSQPAVVSVPTLFYDVMQRSAAFDFFPSGSLLALPQLALLNRIQSRAIRHIGKQAALCYNEPKGTLQLREQIAMHYQSIGLELSASDFCLTAGCQHALFMALKATCKPGDVVAVEQPGFYGVLQLLEQLQLRALEIPMQQDGLDVQALAKAIEQWPIAACVTTPSFATPTGACLSKMKKHQLLALAEQYGFAIIEDDVYGDLGFFERPTPLKALDKNDRVILCGSFSKSLSRDVRVGWISAGSYQAQVQRLKLVSQLAGSQTTEVALADFMSEGHYRRHLLHFRKRLAYQHEQLQNNLNMLFVKQSQIHWSMPQGGLALWLELPTHIDTMKLYQAGLPHGLVLTPGPLFSSSLQFHNFIRLSFTNPLIGEREKALKLLAELIEKTVKIN